MSDRIELILTGVFLLICLILGIIEGIIDWMLLELNPEPEPEPEDDFDECEILG